MNLSKPVTPIRNYAVGSMITALILLGPVVTFLMVITAQILIDLLMVGGISAVCAVAAGSIGLVLSRKFWRRPEWWIRRSRNSRREKRPLPPHQCDAPDDQFGSPFVMWKSARRPSGLGQSETNVTTEPWSAVEWIADADLTRDRSIGIRFHIAEIRPVRAKFAAEQFHARIAPNNAMTLSRIEWLWPLKRA